MTDRRPLRPVSPSPLRPTRRAALIGLSAPALAAPFLTLSPASAQTGPSGDGPLEVTVTGGEFQPIPVAIPQFLASDPTQVETAAQIAGVVAADLESSGLFRLLPAGPLPSIDVPPPFDVWRAQGADALIAAELGFEPDGRIGLRFRLWDLVLGEQADQLKFLAAPNGWRRVAHKLADVVYAKLTGEQPYFDSRVVFVEERGPKNDRRKRLAIMDQDGAALSYLTNDQNIVLTPRFSPAEQAITFISYESGQPEVYLLDLNTERQEALGNFPGMTFAPRFSPDGQRVVMSLTRNGGTDIYLMDLATRRTPASDGERGHRHGAELRARQLGDRVRERPRREPAALRDGPGRRRGGAHQLRSGPLRDAGLVADGRSHRVHQDPGRPLRHRRDAAGRLGGAHPHGELSRRGADLGAERAHGDVLPRDPRRSGASAALHGRHLSRRRAPRADAGRRVRSRMVAASQRLTLRRRAARRY